MKNTTARTIVGLILIILGLLFIADNLNFYPFPFMGFIFSWPAILIIVGAAIIVSSRDNFVGYILLIIGLLAVLRDHYHLTLKTLIHDYWPVLIIGLGVYLLLKKNNTSNMKTNS
ncbi:LiaI-LiaF-like domain-containing protein [Bacteroidota bacterium]